MAKRRRVGSDHVPGNPLAEYLQQHRFAHTTYNGAGSVCSEIQTGMRRPLLPTSAERVGAWEIHAVTVRPSIVAANASPYAAASCYGHFQLLYGQYTAILNEGNGDYDDLIAGGSFHLDLATDGANSHFWPMALDIVNPRPVFAEYLTFASYTPNIVPVNNCQFIVSIWYAPIELDARQTELLLAMRARL